MEDESIEILDLFMSILDENNISINFRRSLQPSNNDLLPVESYIISVNKPIGVTASPLVAQNALEVITMACDIISDDYISVEYLGETLMDILSREEHVSTNINIKIPEYLD